MTFPRVAHSSVNRPHKKPEKFRWIAECDGFSWLLEVHGFAPFSDYREGFVCHLVFNIPLRVAWKGYGSGIAAAPKGNGGLLQVYPFPTPDGEAVIVGVSQRLLLPITTRESKRESEQNKGEKKKPYSVWSSPSPTPLFGADWRPRPTGDGPGQL